MLFNVTSEDQQMLSDVTTDAVLDTIQQMSKVGSSICNLSEAIILTGKLVVCTTRC